MAYSFIMLDVAHTSLYHKKNIYYYLCLLHTSTEITRKGHLISFHSYITIIRKGSGSDL